MSKHVIFAALAASALSYAAPVRAEMSTAQQQWMDTLTDRDRKWRDCPVDEAHATADNPYFRFNPSTADPKFSCRQVGPHILTSSTWAGTEIWYFQHARFLRVKPCTTYPTCSTEKGECLKSVHCKVEAIRVCTLAFVGKPQPLGPYGDGTGKNGCEMIWAEETVAQAPK